MEHEWEDIRNEIEWLIGEYPNSPEVQLACRYLLSQMTLLEVKRWQRNHGG